MDTEAEMAKNRIAELKEQEFYKLREEMAMKQQQEREEVESAHIQEYQEFNKKWDEDMQATQEEHDQLLRALEEQHVKELEENRANLENNLPTIPKASAELLNNKKIQEQLARQKE